MLWRSDIPQFSPASEPTPVLSQSELLTFVKLPAADPTRTSAPISGVLAAIDPPTRLPREDTPLPAEKPRRISRRML